MKTLFFLLALCVSISAQTTLTDINKVELNQSADVKIEVAHTATPTHVMKIRTGETGSADYDLMRFSYNGNNGETREDHVLCLGYGCNALTTDHQWSMSFESFYKTNLGRKQSEWYITAAPPNANGVTYRPLSIDFYHDDYSTQVAATTQSFTVGAPNGSPWLHFQSTSTAGIMRLVADSKIDFSGNTREYFIVSAGTGLMGKVGNVFKLFVGGIQGETVNIFEGSSSINSPLTLNVGEGSLKLDLGKWKANDSVILTTS